MKIKKPKMVSCKEEIIKISEEINKPFFEIRYNNLFAQNNLHFIFSDKVFCNEEFNKKLFNLISLGIKREHDFKTLLPYYKSYTNDFKKI